MDKSASIAALAFSLTEAQGEMPKAVKDHINPFFKSKYAGLDSVMPLALDVLSKHGLAISQMPSHIDGHSALTTIIMHGSSGEWIACDQPLLLPKDDPQGQGAAITYARRYALMAAIGMVADEDDDANAASPQNGKARAHYDEIRANASGGVEKAPSISNWSKVAGKSKYPGKCYDCGNKYGTDEDVFWRKNADGKYDRKHGYDCMTQDAPPSDEQVPLPVEEP